MYRHELLARLAVALRLMRDDGLERLFADYRAELANEPPGAPFLSFETWCYQFGLLDADALSVLTRELDVAELRCGQGHTFSGVDIGETNDISCPECGDANVELASGLPDPHQDPDIAPATIASAPPPPLPGAPGGPATLLEAGGPTAVPPAPETPQSRRGTARTVRPPAPSPAPMPAPPPAGSFGGSPPGAPPPPPDGLNEDEDGWRGMSLDDASLPPVPEDDGWGPPTRTGPPPPPPPPTVASKSPFTGQAPAAGTPGDGPPASDSDWAGATGQVDVPQDDEGHPDTHMLSDTGLRPYESSSSDVRTPPGNPLADGPPDAAPIQDTSEVDSFMQDVLGDTIPSPAVHGIPTSPTLPGPDPHDSGRMESGDQFSIDDAELPGADTRVTPEALDRGLEPGMVIGGCQIAGVLGKGGMGIVYKAIDLQLDRPVAVKVMSSQLAENTQHARRFRKEARAAARLQHPNVVQVYSFGMMHRHPYIVMQFIDGVSLMDRIRNGQPLTTDELCDHFARAAAGLQSAHRIGVIHRDVKPDNLILDRDGDVKVADFGLAKLTEAESALSVSGMIMGTPHYMPPEQVRGDNELDARADIYSLGMTVVHAATGQFPYSGAVMHVLYAQLEKPPPDLRSQRPDLPEALTDLVSRMVAKAPAERPATMEEVRSELVRILDPGASQSARLPVTPALAPPSDPGLADPTLQMPVAGLEMSDEASKHDTDPMMPPSGPATLMTTAILRRSDLPAIGAAADAAAEGFFNERVDRVRALNEAFRYEEALAEVDALMAAEPGNPTLRHEREKASEAIERKAGLEQRIGTLREAGDLDGAEAACLELQELVPLGAGPVDILRDIRHEKEQVEQLGIQVQQLSHQQQYDEALALLDAAVAERPDLPKLRRMRDTLGSSIDSRRAVRAAIDDGRFAEAMKSLESLLQDAPDDRTLQAMLGELKQRERMARHDEVATEARKALRTGGEGEIRRLIQQLRAIIPGSGVANELEAKLAGRKKRRKLAMIGVAALVVLAGIGVGVVLLIQQQQESAFADANDPSLSAAGRVEKLQAYLDSYPDDTRAQEALQAAKDARRAEQLQSAMRLPELAERLRALEQYLIEYPGDPEAEVAKQDTIDELARRREEARVQHVLNTIIRETPDPTARLAAIDAFLQQHPDHRPGRIAREEARIAIEQQALAHAASLGDPLASWTAIDELASRIADESGHQGWADLRQMAGQRVTAVRQRLSDSLAAEARVMARSTAREARAFVERLERTAALDVSLSARFADERAVAERVIHEDGEAERLEAAANAADFWYRAQPVLVELKELRDRVPRLAGRLRPTIAEMEAVAAQAPPDFEGFTYLRQQDFAAGGAEARLSIYRCEAFARALELPDVPDRLDVRDAVDGEWTRADVEFVLMPPVGRETAGFTMGSPASETGHSANERQHRVTLTKPWLMARTEVSQAVWNAVYATLDIGERRLVPRNPSVFQGDMLPVESVTREEATAFCEATGLRLPTEAQWAYAARGGTQTTYSTGARITREQANFGQSRPAPGQVATVAVGSLPSNAFGLHEVHGNVMEWCADWFARFDGNPVTDPFVGHSRDARAVVLRGGSWTSSSTGIRSAFRTGAAPSSASSRIGFRPAASVDND